MMDFHHDRTRALFCPFTTAQLQELERQAMVYKYMMASVPVPFDLLGPSSPVSAPSLSPYENVRVGLKGGDVEPGRCRRTDGKKWRCSRDVVATHKYCERHLHRGRSRSRKPLECYSATSFNRSSKNSGRAFRALSPSVTTLGNKNGVRVEKDGSFEPLVSSASLCRGSRSLNWEMNGVSFPIAIPTERKGFGVRFSGENPSCKTVNASQFTNANYGQESVNLHSYADIACLNFIDVWSNGTSSVQDPTPLASKSPVSSSIGNLSISAEDEMGRIQIGLGLSGSVQDDESGISLTEMSNRLAPATLGGPLGEIMRPSLTVGDREPCITLGTTVSSPSGVLKRAIASLSDGSSNMSPNRS